MNKRLRQTELGHYVGEAVFERVALPEFEEPPLKLDDLVSQEFTKRYASVFAAAHFVKRHGVLGALPVPQNNVLKFLLSCSPSVRSAFDYYFLKGQRWKTDKFSHWLHETLGAWDAEDFLLAMRHFSATPELCNAVVAFRAARVALATLNAEKTQNEREFFGELERRVTTTAQEFCDLLARDAVLASYEPHASVAPGGENDVVEEIVAKLIDMKDGEEISYNIPSVGWSWAMSRLLANAFEAAGLRCLDHIVHEHLAFRRISYTPPIKE